jgi:protein Mpv17
MTRGWSTSEISMRIPLDNWGAYESNLANKPIVTKTLINVIIYLLGDWLSQTAFQKKNLLNFDIKRTLRNGFIGKLYTFNVF